MSRLANSNFLVMDTETTGIDPATCKVVEFAWVLTSLIGPLAAGTSLVNPGCHIPPEASAVHHLVDADVADEPPLEAVLADLPLQLRGLKVHAFVAHNAAFDSAFLPSLRQLPWLCTYRLARRLMPDFPAFGNQYLRYALKLDVPEAQGHAAHRALADAYVTAATLRFLLNRVVNGWNQEDPEGIVPPIHHFYPDWPQEIADLSTFLAAPMLLKTCGFGKHKGEPWSKVPKNYLRWLVDNMKDRDQDTDFTARYYLGGAR
jgi:exodeoxyribonuclease X